MTYERDYVSTQPAPQAGAADLAQPSSGIPTEAGIAWQSGATWPNERKAVTVEGHAWYRHDHPRFAAHPTEQPSQDAVDAAKWREHVGKLDALVAFCPTCCEGKVASADMTRDEVIFQCGRTSGKSEAARAAQAQGGST